MLALERGAASMGAAVAIGRLDMTASALATAFAATAAAPHAMALPRQLRKSRRSFSCVSSRSFSSICSAPNQNPGQSYRLYWRGKLRICPYTRRPRRFYRKLTMLPTGGDHKLPQLDFHPVRQNLLQD